MAGDCPTGNIPQRVCDLETALAAILASVGHSPFTLTYSGAVFAFDLEAQTGNIPLAPEAVTSTPDTVVWADDTARALLAPVALNQIGIQTTDATNGNKSLWVATGLAVGNWALKVGTMGVQNSNSVSVTGGSITGITDLLVADGGTGASNAAGARTNLAIASGTPAIGVIDWVLTDTWFEFISANATYSFTNEADGTAITVVVASGGAYTVAWPLDVVWPGGVEPVHSGSGFADVYTFVHINGDTYGTVVQGYPNSDITALA